MASTGSKLLRAAYARQHPEFFKQQALAALAADVAAVTPKPGEPGAGRRLLAQGNSKLAPKGPAK